MTRNRRAFLASIGMTGASALVAGCSSSEDDTPAETDDSAGTDTTTADATTTAPTADTTTTAPTTAEQTAASTTDDQTTTAGGDPVVTPPGEAPRSASGIDPSDGFAEMAPWLEEEDVEVRRVTESDLDRRSFIGKVIGSNPRVVVFETSGTIDLEGRTFTIGNGKLWIAGQTAPSPGITLTRGSLKIEADDCVVQHLRVRPGDGADESPASMDAIFTQDDTQNNVIDHCSMSWSIDENMSVGYDTDRTTVTNCLIAEPLNDSLHPKGPHGYNSLIGDNSKRVTLAGNVYANATDRHPRLKEGNESAIANNLFHHYADGCVMGDCLDCDGEPINRVSLVGNIWQQPQTDLPAIRSWGKANPDVYIEDNVVRGGVPKIEEGIETMDERPLWPDGLEALDSGETESQTLTHAGARPADRTEHDQRIVDMIRNDEGHVIDSQEEVGGYPELEENTRSLSVPDENLRAWLRQHALEVEP